MKTVDPDIGSWPCVWRDGRWWVGLPQDQVAHVAASLILGQLYAEWSLRTKEPCCTPKRKKRK